MDRWTLIAMLVFGAGGTLVFLRVVCNEVALQLRALTIRLEREARNRTLTKSRETDLDSILNAETVPAIDAQAA